MEQDGLFCNKSSRAIDALETNRANPVKCPREIRACSSKNMTWLIEELRCFSACIMGNKKTRSWKPLCCYTMIKTRSLKLSGMNHMTEALESMAINCL